ncbi:MAG: hypothetical protein K9J37_14805 [Saprospiraceae bacterium]|nr:hypothetical protein [Saprospiraceae bacterium]MCF8251178.1 hypothetical protein [Saprospiraceae bacterium]MCF8281901.1 hypothetical protein [Bacteroidales bacterium]MCF8312990.1 hypothetical protein [Saprospiraceae bacterium]MCF8441437.1 hypothetical protein [Saprospiraceae bacterium]
MATSTIRRATKSSNTIAFLILVSRLVLFVVFQALIALMVNSWETSEKYWLLTATLTNIVSIALLFILFKRDGDSYFKIFSFDRERIKKDIVIFLGLALVPVPIVFVPGYFLSIMIWGDPNVPTGMMFGPIEKWLVYILLIAFPVTIAFAELATYFVYIMPKLKKQLKVKWLAALLPIVFLSIQHCTLPFIPDLNFIMYRALVFLPFAILIGVSIYYRPSLFIYFAILHGLMDFGTAFMFLSEIK